MPSASLEALLAPISPERPGGVELDGSSDIDTLRRLRQGDDPHLSQGEWVRELRTPQWPQVREHCERILARQSKDLRVACWYLEALAQVEGFPGVAFGLSVLEGLLERHWDATPPALFPGDREERIARLEWLNDDRQLPLVIAGLPMTGPETGGLSRLSWEESRLVDNLGLRDPQARDQAIAEGKLAGEAWHRALRASGKDFCLQRFKQIEAAQASFQTFEERVDHCCGQDAPPLGTLREALGGCAELAGRMLRSFGLDPGAESPSTPAPALSEDSGPPASVSASLPWEPVGSRAEALRLLREVATYYRDQEPHSPVGPLVERAVRWGEMPLGQWLARVVKDEGTLSQLRELLDLHPIP